MPFIVSKKVTSRLIKNLEKIRKCDTKFILFKDQMRNIFAQISNYNFRNIAANLLEKSTKNYQANIQGVFSNCYKWVWYTKEENKQKVICNYWMLQSEMYFFFCVLYRYFLKFNCHLFDGGSITLFREKILLDYVCLIMRFMQTVRFFQRIKILRYLLRTLK